MFYLKLLIVHFADKLPVDPSVKFHAVVDGERRRLSAANHSATHLLHAALKEVLGDHVQQKGSLVNDKHLRFDFSHFSKVTEEELVKIENLVNETLQWLEGNTSATKEDYDEKYKEVETICGPKLSKLYQLLKS